MCDFLPADKGKEQEEGTAFRPRFDKDGLVTAVACDWQTREVLMLAFMNAEALKLTIDTGKAHYWSRSRRAIWLKGETSGNVQIVRDIRTDCDQDAIVMMVEIQGDQASCHTGRVSCFYRSIKRTKDGSYALNFDERPPRFDPQKVYDQS